MTKKTNKGNEQFKVSKNEKIFALVKDENGKIVVCAGGYAVSEKKFDTFEQADQYIATKPYEIIINLFYVLKKKDNEIKIENPQDK